MRILVADDDGQLRGVIARGLRANSKPMPEVLSLPWLRSVSPLRSRSDSELLERSQLPVLTKTRPVLE